MVKPEIIDNILHLHVMGDDKFWALKSQLSIPLEHVTGIRIADEKEFSGWWKGLKIPGSNLPGMITAGTFYQDGRQIFWDIHYRKEAVVISLDHEKYDELVVEVEKPEEFVREVLVRVGGGMGGSIS